MFNKQSEIDIILKISSGAKTDLINTCNVYECLIRHFFVSGHKYIFL